MTEFKTGIMEKKADFKHNPALLNCLAKYLDLCCLKRETVTYLEAADAIGVAAPQRIHQITQLLEALIDHDQKLGQPIRAALVVSRTNSGLPGEVFFLKAKALGLMSGVSAQAFHKQCLNRLFDV